MNLHAGLAANEVKHSFHSRVGSRLRGTTITQPGRGHHRALVLALTAIPTLAFAARLRERVRIALGTARTLPNLAFGAGVLTAAGFLGAAAIHFALADYARDLDLSAAPALNALDADSFILFTAGIATIVLAGLLIALRSRMLPVWLGWIGIPVVAAMFTPVGFFVACVAGAWIIVASLVMYASDDQPDGATKDRGRFEPDPGSQGGARAARLASTPSPTEREMEFVTTTGRPEQVDARQGHWSSLVRPPMSSTGCGGGLAGPPRTRTTRSSSGFRRPRQHRTSRVCQSTVDQHRDVSHGA